MVESVEDPAIIFTNHRATTSIAKQTTLSLSNTDKLNLHLVHALQYLLQFPLDIYHKEGKLNLIPDALSQLLCMVQPTMTHEVNKDTLGAFHIALVELDVSFKKHIIDGYAQEEPWWCLIEMIQKHDRERDNKPLGFQLNLDRLIYFI